MTAVELKQEIETAFRSGRCPADYQIVGHACPECERVADDFRGRNWRDVPLHVLFYHHDSLPLFTPVAFRYFLPAYLLAAVFHHEKSNLIPDSVVRQLIPPSRSEGESDEEHRSWLEHYHERVDRFTPAQRKALISWLEFMKQERGTDIMDNGMDRAIEETERLLSPTARFR